MNNYSVIIPLYNKKGTIIKTLESVLNQSYKPSQIIIVDDKSTDNSLDIVNGYSKCNSKIHIYENAINMGKAGTINWAVKNKVIYPFTLVIDADTFLDKDFMVEAMKGFENKNILGVCGQVYPAKTDTFIEKTRAVEYTQCPLVKWIQNKIKGTWVLSGCASVWKTTFINEHPYPTHHLVEDMDITWIAQSTKDNEGKQHEVAFMGKAKCFTDEPATFKGLISQLHRWYSNRVVVKQRFRKTSLGLKCLAIAVIGVFLLQLSWVSYAALTGRWLWFGIGQATWTSVWVSLVLIQNLKFKLPIKKVIVGLVGFFVYIWLCFGVYFKCLIKPKGNW